MNPKIWQSSQKNYFPYNISLNAIVRIPLVLPIAFLLYEITFIHGNQPLFKTVLQIILVSVFAYYLSDKMIYAFKDRLCRKGLFGRDLNKAGIQKDKQPV